MREITLPSGAIAKIDAAPWDDAIALKAAIARELSGADLSALKFDPNAEVDVGQFAKLALLVDSSKPVMDAIFKCLARCTYDGQRITKETFERVEARKDFYDVAFACLQENIGPFFENLLSKLRPLMEKAKGLVELPK